MAIILATTSPWPFFFKDQSKDNAIHEILQAVFKFTKDNFSVPGVDSKQAAQDLRKNIAFWRLQARVRGVDSEVDCRFRGLEICREDLLQATSCPNHHRKDGHKGESIRFMSWLLRPGGSTLRVCDFMMVMARAMNI